MGVERVVDSADRLGECPLWDERSQALWRVDILAPAINCLSGEGRLARRDADRGLRMEGS